MQLSFPIRYINLARDTDRRAAMQAEFERLGLEGERFDAIWWTGLTPDEQAALYSPGLNAQQFHQPLVDGEKGCYASHIGLWRWLLESPHLGLVVLEDDVTLKDSFAAVCQAIANRPPGWDMVKLIGREELGKGEKLRCREPLCHGHDWVQYRRVPSLTAGYVISRAGAQKLLATRVPFGRPIDVDLRHWWEGLGLQVTGVQPAAITLADTSLDSSIGDKIGRPTWRLRWRKFRHKLAYTVGNTWHGGLR